jgi:hypothetical protein
MDRARTTHQHFRKKRQIAGTAMVFLLVAAIVGELTTFALVVPFYGFLAAFCIAPIGGALAALMAGVIVSRKNRPTDRT